MLKSKVQVLIKIAEMTVCEKIFRETDDDVREDVEKKKKYRVSYLKVQFAFLITADIVTGRYL